jgi:predicted porin
MKRKIASATVFVLSAAYTIPGHAQSSVTLYGLIDEGVTYVNNVAGHSVVEMQSSMSFGSRWGLKGTEDLGNGMKAIFRLENGFDPSSGSLSQGGRLFGRQAFVGLSSDQYGTVTFGRQYDELLDMVSRTTASLQGGVMFARAGDIDNTSGTIRINNAVKYSSPTIAGFTFGGLYGFGGQPGQFSAQSTTSLGVSFSRGPLYIAAAYTLMKNPFAAGFDSKPASNTIYAPYVPSASSWRVMAAGALYTAGTVSTGVACSSTRFADGMDGANVDFNNCEINAGWFVRPDLQFLAAFDYTHGKIDATGQAPNYRAFDLKADYFLSKRTDLYLAAVYMTGSAGASPPQIELMPAPSSTPNQVAVHLGIRHLF